jgi:hypothetical protein
MSLEAELWEASEEKLYGYGAGHAHPSVEWVTCPLCGAAPGRLCHEGGVPKLSRHYMRCYAFDEVRRLWREAGLEYGRGHRSNRRSRAELRRLLSLKGNTG